jgi:type I restriction enzyme M protein
MSDNGSTGGGTTREIVAKLWSLCHVLRDDGISFSDYVTELTFLLFLKMLAETGHEERLPKGYRWTGLARREGLDQLEHYRQLLLDLGNPAKAKDQLVLSIFTDAQTKLRKPTNLKSLTDAIDKLDWFWRGKRALAISMRVCSKRMPLRKSPEQGSISHLAR